MGILSQTELKRSIQTKELAYPNGIPFSGVDALRFTLCHSDVREHFIKFDPNKCEEIHRFFNKIWNATKFTIANCDSFSVDPNLNPIIQMDRLSAMDKWILSRLSNTIIDTTNALNSFNIGCASLWQQFFYENLCDVYIEASKYNFQNRHAHEAQPQCEVLKACLTIGLRHMGVFTPFLSNELLNYLPHQMEFQVLIYLCSIRALANIKLQFMSFFNYIDCLFYFYVRIQPTDWINDALETDMQKVLEVCSEIRKIKRVQNVLKKHGPRSEL